MRRISIKAVLISNAVQLSMTVLMIFVSAFAILGVAWGLAHYPADIDPITEELKASSLVVLSIGLISVVPSSLTAGYVAGRIAGGCRPVLHGAFSSSVWFFILTWIALKASDTLPGGDTDREPAMPAVLTGLLFLGFWGAPLLGALGGFIAQPRGRPPGAQAPNTSTCVSRW